MRTYVYLSKSGVKYAVFHRNAANKTWQHSYQLRDVCPLCLGTSTTMEDAA